MLPTSRIFAPVLSSNSGSLKPSPISISSPLLTIISRPAASAVAASTSAAALLLTTCTACASGTALASAASIAAPRRPRAPVARSNSRSVHPAAALRASRAAADSGARPRLVCNRTPVALTMGVRLAASRGSPVTAAAATSSGRIWPSLARCCARCTASRTSGRPSRSSAAASRGSARTASVRGTSLRASSTTATIPRGRDTLVP